MGQGVTQVGLLGTCFMGFQMSLLPLSSTVQPNFLHGSFLDSSLSFQLSPSQPHSAFHVHPICLALSFSLVLLNPPLVPFPPIHEPICLPSPARLSSPALVLSPGEEKYGSPPWQVLLVAFLPVVVCSKQSWVNQMLFRTRPRFIPQLLQVKDLKHQV